MSKPVINVERSVHQRLLNHAKAGHQPFEHVLKRYAMERFLYRLSMSPFANDFILKGGLLLACYELPSSRPTLDIDLQCFFADHRKQRIETMISQLCKLEVDSDGLRFDESSLVCESLKHLDGYAGIGAHFLCYLGKAAITVKIDIGFGESLRLKPVLIDYPTLLEMAKPRLMAYRQENIIAEKYEAMLKHDLATTRMKDFYDIYVLSRTFEYEAVELSIAVKQVFRHCKRVVEANPAVFQEAFFDDLTLALKWRAFLRKNGLIDAPNDFRTVMKEISHFLLPIVNGLARKTPMNGRWMTSGYWKVS